MDAQKSEGIFATIQNQFDLEDREVTEHEVTRGDGKEFVTRHIYK